eukprot:TRINITY_DN17105_c0_g1_i1.p1 TRINITY_DN17105_c0_g1~~TRINITY_DN17105_c0_g1_i1.p1  ORF type:complete len:284 (+),score=67.68 TRINITY_DN17105_c0_g1_i1:150-1001(+)
MSGKGLEAIENDEEFVKRVEKAKAEGSRVVVQFTAQWCGPCKAIGPVYESLSKQYSTGVFLKVDIDKCKHVSQSLGIRSIPTFHFYLGDTLVYTLKGADKTKLQESVKKLMESEKDVLEKIAAEGEAEHAEETFVEGDLQVLHDLKRCECLNDLPGSPFTNIFLENDERCTSDVDEQLLMTLAYKDPVTVKSIKFIAPDDGSGPKKVKLFVNFQTLGFSEAEDYPCTQEITLTPEDLKEDSKAIPVQTVKFLKTDTLTIFVYNNQGDLEQTSLTRLIVHGTKS